MEQVVFPPSPKEIGRLGEQITAHYLDSQGFHVLELNYWRKWGEIDVIAEKDAVVHFVEVKTVSYGTKNMLHEAVSYGTWRPEDNVHAFKIKKLSRVIETWISDNKWQGDWQIDVAAVRCVPRETFATINLIENIILD